MTCLIYAADLRSGDRGPSEASSPTHSNFIANSDVGFCDLFIIQAPDLLSGDRRPSLASSGTLAI